MQFTDYYNKIYDYFASKRNGVVMVEKNSNIIFESYINDEPMKECIKRLMKNTMTESKNGETLEYKTYSRRVKRLLETFGYDKKNITPKVEKQISDLYDIEEDEYACAELCKKTIEQEQKYKPVKITKSDVEKIQNNLIIGLHKVSNAALLNLDVSPQAAVITLKIRLFQDLKEIDTDVKSYIKEIHKYLNAFALQNSNTDIEHKIKSYAIKFNNLYCTTEFKIPFINPDGTAVNRFNTYDISRLIRSYLNMLDTFTEQYKNII